MCFCAGELFVGVHNSRWRKGSGGEHHVCRCHQPGAHLHCRFFPVLPLLPGAGRCPQAAQVRSMCRIGQCRCCIYWLPICGSRHCIEWTGRPLQVQRSEQTVVYVRFALQFTMTQSAKAAKGSRLSCCIRGYASLSPALFLDIHFFLLGASCFTALMPAVMGLSAADAFRKANSRS